MEERQTICEGVTESFQSWVENDLNQGQTIRLKSFGGEAICSMVTKGCAKLGDHALRDERAAAAIVKAIYRHSNLGAQGLRGLGLRLADKTSKAAVQTQLLVAHGHLEKILKLPDVPALSVVANLSLSFWADETHFDLAKIPVLGSAALPSQADSAGDGFSPQLLLDITFVHLLGKVGGLMQTKKKPSKPLLGLLRLLLDAGQKISARLRCYQSNTNGKLGASQKIWQEIQVWLKEHFAQTECPVSLEKLETYNTAFKEAFAIEETQAYAIENAVVDVCDAVGVDSLIAVGRFLSTGTNEDENAEVIRAGKTNSTVDC